MASDAQHQRVEGYSALLEQLSAAPFDRALHEQRIALAQELALADEVEQARNALTETYPLSEAEWTAWIDDRKAALPPPPTDEVTPFLDLVELYRRANRDHLSIPLLVSWTQWTIANYYAAQGLSAPPPPADVDDEDAAMQPANRKVGEPDELLGVVFSLEEVRGICDEVLRIAGPHIAESSKVWTLWRDFEVDLLELDPSPDQLLQVDELYRARLKVPHLDIAETFSAYSSFVTAFDNENYDKSLPAANKIYSGPAKKADDRYAEEEKLKAAGYTAQAYLDYVAWEREVKRPDTPLVKGIFERAVKDHPTNLDVWEEYLSFLNKIPPQEANLREVAEKAVRNLPSSVSLWAAAMRAVEKLGLGAEEVEALFQRAVATGLFAKDMDSTVALYHARASYYRREMDRNATDDGPDAQLAGLAIGVLQEGAEATKQVHKKGDPQNRLEKFLIRIYERFQMTNEARAIWANLCETRQHSYAAWYGHADFETRMGDFKRAHEIYTQGCAVKGLDFPEYLIEAWITFEHEYGTLADVEFALLKSKRQKKGLERRRMREAAEAAAAAAAAAPAPDADSFIASAVAGASSAQDGADPSKKRERSPQDEARAAQGAKKVRVEAPESGEPKRDREHSTVFAISEGNMTEEDVRKLFRDCGEIRELRVKTIGEKTYAQIEFVEKESVLAAQTKDKKRINDLETEVYVAWQSCLYVTNFPESFDKAALEHLFAKYGTIFDTRWPSKRFKNTRRFCYVQFANPAHAQAALELHGTELEPGHALSVLVSDPSRKKSRSDATANQRELYVASLAKSVKEGDLRKLFEPFGTVVGIRIPQDDKGMCKGFAFVEFEAGSAAQEALTLNNHELKKRHMSVTVAQARQVGTGKFNQPERRTETENRGVRVRGLATDTQEAVIQQEFEKIAPVRRVNYVAGSTEAVVLLENPADVGKVLMQRDALLIGGQQVTLLSEGRQTRAPGGGGGQGGRNASAAGEGEAPVPMMPRQASRGRGRVGLVGGRGGGRGGRLGIGAGRSVGALAAAAQGGDAASARTSAGGEGEKPAEGKSQDDFRAMLKKKKE
ncbi:Splicing factor [Rhodotorula kratochvilovae]